MNFCEDVIVEFQILVLKETLKFMYHNDTKINRDRFRSSIVWDFPFL